MPRNRVRIGIANARRPGQQARDQVTVGPSVTAAPSVTGPTVTGAGEPGEVGAALLPERVAPLLRLLAHVEQQRRVPGELLHPGRRRRSPRSARP